MPACCRIASITLGWPWPRQATAAPPDPSITLPPIRRTDHQAPAPKRRSAATGSNHGAGRGSRSNSPNAAPQPRPGCDPWLTCSTGRRRQTAPGNGGSRMDVGFRRIGPHGPPHGLQPVPQGLSPAGERHQHGRGGRIGAAAGQRLRRYRRAGRAVGRDRHHAAQLRHRARRADPGGRRDRPRQARQRRAGHEHHRPGDDRPAGGGRPRARHRLRRRPRRPPGQPCRPRRIAVHGGRRAGRFRARQAAAGGDGQHDLPLRRRRRRHADQAGQQLPRRRVLPDERGGAVAVAALRPEPGTHAGGAVRHHRRSMAS